MKKSRVIANLIAPFVGVAAFVAVWWIVAACVDKTVILPTPWQTLKQFFLLFGKGEFYSAVGTTLARTLISFAFAFLLACGFAALAAFSRFFEKAFFPIVVIMRVLPTISIILLVLIWFYSNVAPYVITFIVIFPMLYSTVLNAIKSVDNGLLEMAEVYKMPLSRKVTKVYIPEMLPQVFNGVSITLSFCVKLTVAAEVLSFTANSMGRFMQQSSVYIDTPLLLAWTIAAVLLGFMLEGAVLLIKRFVMGKCYGNK